MCRLIVLATNDSVGFFRCLLELAPFESYSNESLIVFVRTTTELALQTRSHDLAKQMFDMKNGHLPVCHPPVRFVKGGLWITDVWWAHVSVLFAVQAIMCRTSARDWRLLSPKGGCIIAPNQRINRKACRCTMNSTQTHFLEVSRVLELHISTTVLVGQ